jgi:SPOR domain
MGHFSGTARAALLAGCGAAAVIFTGLAGTDFAAAAEKSKTKAAAPAAPVTEADQKQQIAAQTRQAYEAGVKSYSAGKYQPAVDQLSGALRAGGLGSAEMAKAMYVRGMAYKKLSKPGLAISDLTSALWLKNGLGEADQKSAMAERSEAYRLAGLGDGNTGNDSVSVADPNPVPAGSKASVPAAPAVAAAVPTSAVKTSGKKVKPTAAAPAVAAPVAAPVAAEVTRQSPDSEAARDAANARKLAATPVETGGLQSIAAGSLISNASPSAAAVPAGVTAAIAPVPPLATPAVTAPVAVAAAMPNIPAPIPIASSPATPVLAAAPIEGMPSADVTVASKSSAPNTVTGFFSNLFGGGSTAPAPQPVTQSATTPVTTASTTPAAAPSNGSDSTSVANGAAKKSAAAQAAPQAVAAAPVSAAAVQPSGKYKLHIAAVRSRGEAEALAQKLASQNGAALKSRIPVVDEAVIGSMGTFYRVRVGSYANAEEPRGVCNTLRTSGFDCLVVTN